MAKKKKQKWLEGDIFLVPQSDSSFSVGQVLRITKKVLNSVICSFYDLKATDSIDLEQLNEERLIAILFTTSDLLDSGDWRIMGRAEPLHLDLAPRAELNLKKLVGTKIIGSGIVIKFLDAFYGLRPWDGFADPAYFDKLLLSPNRKPRKGLLYSKILEKSKS